MEHLCVAQMMIWFVSSPIQCISSIKSADSFHCIPLTHSRALSYAEPSGRIDDRPAPTSANLGVVDTYTAAARRPVCGLSNLYSGSDRPDKENLHTVRWRSFSSIGRHPYHRSIKILFIHAHAIFATIWWVVVGPAVNRRTMRCRGPTTESSCDSRLTRSMLMTKISWRILDSFFFTHLHLS
jgi:hypothetical protein